MCIALRRLFDAVTVIKPPVALSLHTDRLLFGLHRFLTSGLAWFGLRRFLTSGLVWFAQVSYLLFVLVWFAQVFLLLVWFGLHRFLTSGLVWFGLHRSAGLDGRGALHTSAQCTPLLVTVWPSCYNTEDIC